ncbi:hypothetical protein Nepgr_004064 [Nepenthes gracilis]|uniref:Pentatricopeptide repeat-containing protein n=1 Tax=Nepenthes gracilis TaxID=150966 RepID=A0AAD3S0P5_NEPGR|nr:hypothetical protein Nepgr_004064 [Nepenthes gracilis]
MIRLLVHRALPWINPAFYCQTLGWVGFIKYEFSAQAVQLPENCRNHVGPSVSEFDSRAYASTIQYCVFHGEPLKGKALHCQVLKKGNCLDLFALNVLLNFYVKSQLLSDACALFEEMADRNTVSFVTLIQGYGEANLLVKAMELFSKLHRENHELNAFVFTTMLKLFTS